MGCLRLLRGIFLLGLMFSCLPDMPVTEAQGQSVLRTISVGASPLVLAVDARTNRLFVLRYGKDGGFLSMLDAATGTVLRTVPVGPNAPTQPNILAGIYSGFAPGVHPVALAVDEQDARVFVLSDGALDAQGVPQGVGHVVMLDATSGQMLRMVPVGTMPVALAVDAAAGKVFVANNGYQTNIPGTSNIPGSISVLNATTGAVLHTTPVTGYPTALAVDAGIGRVFVAGANDGVDVLDAATGALRATIPVQAASLALDPQRHRLFVRESFSLPPVTLSVLGGEQLSVYDTATDALIYPVLVDPGATAMPVIDQRTGHLVVPTAHTRSALGVNGNTGGQTELISAGTALSACASETAPPTPGVATLSGAAAIDERLGRAFVINDRFTGPGYYPDLRGGVSILDTATGAVLSRLPVGKNPVAVAVDQQTGRVFVANYDDGTVSMFDAALPPTIHVACAPIPGLARPLPAAPPRGAHVPLQALLLSPAPAGVTIGAGRYRGAPLPVDVRMQLGPGMPLVVFRLDGRYEEIAGTIYATDPLPGTGGTTSETGLYLYGSASDPSGNAEQPGMPEGATFLFGGPTGLQTIGSFRVRVRGLNYLALDWVNTGGSGAYEVVATLTGG